MPVAQNEQLSVQPTCDDTHKVPRLSSGMNTISMALLPGTFNNHLRVPSSDKLSEMMSGKVISAVSANEARNDLLKLVISVKSLAPV